MKTINRIAKHAKVDEVFVENSSIVVITAEGYCWEEDCCHTRVFDTVTEALRELPYIKKCSGTEKCCQGMLARIKEARDAAK